MMNKRFGRFILVAGIFFLLFSGMSGCGKTKKQMGRWWERNVADPVKGLKDRQLLVTSSPPQADVFIDDVYQGKTPLRLKFEVGMKDILKGFTVSVQKEGYLPVSRSISHRTEKVTFRLIRAPGK